MKTRVSMASLTLAMVPVKINVVSPRTLSPTRESRLAVLKVGSRRSKPLPLARARVTWICSPPGFSLASISLTAMPTISLSPGLLPIRSSLMDKLATVPVKKGGSLMAVILMRTLALGVLAGAGLLARSLALMTRVS